MNPTILSIILGILGLAIGFSLEKIIKIGKKQKLKEKAESIIEKAKREREEILRKATLEATSIIKEASLKNEEKEKHFQEIDSSLRRKEQYLEEKERELNERIKRQEETERNFKEKELEIEALLQKEREALEEVAGLKKEKAKEMLFRTLEKEFENELAEIIKNKERKIKEEEEKLAQKILATSIQRIAQDFTAEHTVTAISLPSEEMKGRIIGKEGRNIQTFERLAGVDLIIDDTPEIVTISCFDPVRREIARLALEKLIRDGRIHPARIEEVLSKSKEEVEKQIKESGENAVYELGLGGIPFDLIKLLGQLKFRTSYGQNVLQHSIETAFLAKNLAEELGADVNTAKIAALFHDIGKAVDHEVPGSHAKIGKEILKKYGMDEKIINAVAAHHEEEEPKSTEAHIVITADMISGSRPGARREAVEEYIKRIQELENIASSFDGVEKSFAIQAGREVRVFVKPEEISDYEAKKLAKEIARKIEKEVKFPGEIKVITIRETRAQEIAK